MRFDECNARQKTAWMNIQHAAEWYIGELENTLSDCSPDSEEYKDAQATLNDHQGLVDEIYHMAITNIYTGSTVKYGSSYSHLISDIKFCGKDWLLERVEKRLQRLGY